MFLMTAKLRKRRVAAAVCAIAALLAGLFCFLRRPEAAETSAPAPILAETDENRIRYLEQLGWHVAPRPAEAMQIRIPRQPGEVFTRYNELQKSQGFDLSRYAGKTVMRYEYELTGFSEGADPVRATLLVYRDRVIGGDVTDTAPGGKVQGLAAPSAP